MVAETSASKQSASVAALDALDDELPVTGNIVNIKKQMERLRFIEREYKVRCLLSTHC